MSVSEDRSRASSMLLINQGAGGGGQAARREFTKPAEAPAAAAQAANSGGAGPGASAVRVCKRPRIIVKQMSDITKEEHDVMVNSSNVELALSQGQVSKDMLRVGGESIQLECLKNYPNGITHAEIAVTGPGRTKQQALKEGIKERLYYKAIYHCCLVETSTEEKMIKTVKQAVKLCLERADKDKMTSVGFPALGTGNLKFPPKLVATAMFEAVNDYGLKHPDTKISDVVFVLHKKNLEVNEAFKREEDKHKQKLRDEKGEKCYLLSAQSDRHEGNEKHLYFTNSGGSVMLLVAALDSTTINAAVEDLNKAYQDAVVTVNREAARLSMWDPFFINQVAMACRAVDVDVTFNFALECLNLKGFREPVDRVNIHHLLKDAEEELAEREKAHMMAERVQWSWVEVTNIEEILVPYDHMNNSRIEKAYREGQLAAMIYDRKRTPFRIDFAKMEEQPEILLPGVASPDPDDVVDVVRKDKLTEGALDAPAPDGWSPMGGKTLDALPLKPDSVEYKQVHDKFIVSLNQPAAVVVKIDRIQNLTLYKQYMSMWKQMKGRYPENAPDSKFEQRPLWHGTNQATVQNIIDNGFNRSYCERTHYGQAVYFASKAEYSSEDKYAKRSDAGERHIFYCRVLVGDYTKGDEAMRFPPHNPNRGPSDCYDSAVDDVNEPSIYVIFKDVQAYPEYLIVFKDS